MMERVKFKFLDIPIIRSCNLSCGGCLTFSDSKRIKGLVNLEESMPWLTEWASKVDPEAVTIFGGEPLLHPQFIEWCRTVRRLWPNSELRINTNGYYLDRLFDRIPELFIEDIRPQFIVSIQTGHEPYYSIVKNHIETLKEKVLAYLAPLYPTEYVEWNLWLDEAEIFKSWWRIDINQRDTGIRITSCEQHKIPWQAHYQNAEENLKPFYDYNDEYYVKNHSFCQAKNFVNLYQGRLYKCPTVAVVGHTLETFGLNNDTDWNPYISNYQSIGADATIEQLYNWVQTQANPEKVCNMCGFTGPKGTNGHLNRHELKQNWNYRTISIESA
jgi:organic radical activating enzyme